MSHAFVLDHVTYTYPGRDKPAVLDLSLEILEGKTTVLLGPNGAGKSP
jgi:ABC-type multidrug transport system ATPase subunit